jgi:protein O-mannosyl-transferase
MRRLIPLGLLLAILAAYADALHGPFIWDDGDAILRNHHILHLWPLTESMSGKDNLVVAGRPLVCLSLAINYSIGQLNPLGYHLFNIATHVACALLLFGLIQRTMLLPRWRGSCDTSSPWLAGAATLLWALHPLLTEAVDYTVQRSETMMSMFLLLMLYSIARGASSTRHRTLWYLLAIFACAAGMACKETMLVAPILAMVFGLIFLPRDLPGRRFLYGGLVASWLVLLFVLQGQDVAGINPSNGRSVTPWVYLETQAGVIVHYLRLCFWPLGLTVDYRDWHLAPSIWPALAPGALLLILLAATILCCVKRAWPGFVGACFFLILAPTSSVLPLLNEIAAERRMYLPSAAVVILITVGVWQLLRWLLNQSARAAATICVSCLAITLGTSTALRNRDYQSAITLWTDAIKKRPYSPMAHYYLGKAYADQGDWTVARTQAEIAYKLVPTPAVHALIDFINQHDPNAHPPR